MRYPFAPAEASGANRSFREADLVTMVLKIYVDIIIGSMFSLERDTDQSHRCESSPHTTTCGCEPPDSRKRQLGTCNTTATQ